MCPATTTTRLANGSASAPRWTMWSPSTAPARCAIANSASCRASRAVEPSLHEVAPAADVVDLRIAVFPEQQARHAAARAARTADHHRLVARNFGQAGTQFG